MTQEGFLFMLLTCTLWVMIFILVNGMIISPLILFYYTINKKEPNKIISWLLLKTNNSSILIVGIVISVSIFVWWKYIYKK